MELMLDTINLEEIKKYNESLNLAGVTSNPTIVKKEGKVDFFNHMKAIREIIGFERSLHVQVVGTTCEAIIKDAKKITSEIDSEVYIKVPTTTEGLKAMKELKAAGINVTATAIYSIFQGLMAINVGADYIAPYYNRMENMGINSFEVLSTLQNEIQKESATTKILGASFKNSLQVSEALKTGTEAVTIGCDIISGALDTASVKQAVIDFNQDWASLYNNDFI